MNISENHLNHGGHGEHGEHGEMQEGVGEEHFQCYDAAPPMASLGIFLCISPVLPVPPVVQFHSKIRALRCPGKRNHIANVPHPGQEQQHALQPQAETRVRYRAVAAQVEIPPVRCRIEALLLHPFFEDVEAFLALAAADDFADTGDQHVHGSNRFAVVVDTHVERLQRARIVVQDDGVLEVLLGQESLMLRLQVDAPLDRILERLARLEKNINRIGVGDTQERRLEDSGVVLPGDSGAHCAWQVGMARDMPLSLEGTIRALSAAAP